MGARATATCARGAETPRAPAVIALPIVIIAGGLGGVEVQPYLADINIAVIFVVAVSSIGIYGIILGDWTDTGYPATIDSAVRSGTTAADVLAKP